jgi:hypothetical protein
LLIFATTISTAAAMVAIKKLKYQKAEVKVKAFHPSSNQRCMCSWKKLETWLATADLDMGHEGQHPWREYLWQK